MKKNRLVSIIIALIMVLSFSACGSGGSDSASTGTDAPSTAAPSGDAPAASDETFTLTYSYFTSEAIGPGLFIQQAVKNIEERSNGRLKIDTYFNGTLLKTSDVISGCINGTADIVTVDQSIMGEVFPLSNIFSMPFTSIPPAKTKMDEAFNQLLIDRPELGEEVAKEGLMYLGIAPCGGHHLHGISTVYDSPESLKGQAIDGLGEGGKIITALGGNGSTMDPGDWYLSLSTGLLDGQLTHFPVLHGFGTGELLTTHTIFSNSTDPKDTEAMFGGGIYAPMMGNIMNKASYDKLPADLQEILVDEFGKFATYVTALDIPEMAQPALDLALERGDKFVFIGDKDLDPWKPGMQKVIDEWTTKVDGLGYDGKGLYDHLISLFK